MNNDVRILILEDDPADAETSEREVRRSLPLSRFFRVQTTDTLTASLAAFRPDLILSACRPPRLDCMKALASASAPDIPFIVTGTANDWRVDECLKAGAWDFVQSEHINRLGPAVKAGLEHGRMRREQRRAEEELRFRNRGFHRVANAAIELANVAAEHEMCALIVRTLKDLTEAAIATFGLYDPASKRIYVKRAEAEKDIGEELVGAMGGTSLTGYSFPLSDATRLEILANPIGYRISLGEAAFGVPPEPLREAARKLPVTYRFLGIAYWLEGRLYGTSLVALRAATPDPTPELLRLFAQMVAGTVRRVRTEEALRESEARFKSMFESANVGKSITLPTGEITVNRAFCDLLGYTPEELKGSKWQDLTPAEDADPTQSAMDQLTRGEKDSVRFTKRYRHRNGSFVWTDVSSAVLRDPAGKPRYFITTMVDITERRHAEESLIESEHRYRSLIMNSPDAILVTEDNHVVLANHACCRLFGASREEDLVGRSSLSLIHPDYQEQVRERLRLVRESGESVPLTEQKILRIDGVSVDTEIVAAPFRFEGRTAVHVILRDISERNRARSENDRLLAAMEQTGETVVITDPEGVIQYANPAFEPATGFTRAEAIGRNARFLRGHGQEKAAYRGLLRTLASGTSWRGTLDNRRKDGTLYIEEVTISPVRDAHGKITSFAIVGRNITAQRQMEERLRQSQKMETVGQLAGGVAHDFNNMLQVISSYTDMSLAKVDADQPLHRYLQEIRKAAKRSAEITRQLLTFARKQTVSPKVLDLNDAVTKSRPMLQRLIGENIDLAWVPGHAQVMVRMDPAQLDQILANLAANARDAINGVGMMKIETGRAVFEEAYCASHDGFLPGDFVLLAVSDDGCGMDKETMSHLFEPFFTTKGVGKGTGLGLATIYGIVKQNDGFIKVQSDPGKGTTFEVYLLRAEGATAEERTETGTALRRGTETVLVVEDEGAILKLAGEMLQQLGYTVLTASTPEEAIRISGQRGTAIDLLVTDVIMPQMNGKQLAARLAQARPGLKCLYMSGYAADIIAQQDIQEAAASFLAKPFSVRTLAERARELLDRPSTS